MTTGIQNSYSQLPSVRVLPYQPHCFAFGGFDLQMIGAMTNARAAGIDIRPLDLWSRDDEFDILHCWGLGRQHETAVRWARTAGKQVVLTALFGYPSWKSSIRRRLRLSQEEHKWRIEFLKSIDILTVVNADQAEFARTTFGIERLEIRVIPNIVDDRFHRNNGEAQLIPHFKLKQYVLTTGNVCERKNQRVLAAACRKLGVPLVIVGDVLTGEAAYGDALAEDIEGVEKIRWIRGLAAGSSQLVSLYANAALFALPSHDETQPISALEAVAMGKPLLLANRRYAKQAYFANACLANPKSVDSVASAIQKILARPQMYQSPQSAIQACSPTEVGYAYASAYRSVCSRSAARPESPHEGS